MIIRIVDSVSNPPFAMEEAMSSSSSSSDEQQEFMMSTASAMTNETHDCCSTGEHRLSPKDDALETLLQRQRRYVLFLSPTVNFFTLVVNDEINVFFNVTNVSQDILVHLRKLIFHFNLTF